ncbi:hypothetical protein F5883DRAFT_581326 [Diaporthe sp. PMI_573]|nr:hypothetical protein F5883DRAFT_581326 [Diaporthaceae sp. PMI_573]
MVSRNRQTRPSLGGLDQTETKTDQTIPITAPTLLVMTNAAIRVGNRVKRTGERMMPG